MNPQTIRMDKTDTNSIMMCELESIFKRALCFGDNDLLLIEIVGSIVFTL